MLDYEKLSHIEDIFIGKRKVFRTLRIRISDPTLAIYNSMRRILGVILIVISVLPILTFLYELILQDDFSSVISIIYNMSALTYIKYITFMFSASITLLVFEKRFLKNVTNNKFSPRIIGLLTAVLFLSFIITVISIVIVYFTPDEVLAFGFIFMEILVVPYFYALIFKELDSTLQSFSSKMETVIAESRNPSKIGPLRTGEAVSVPFFASLILANLLIDFGLSKHLYYQLLLYFSALILYLIVNSKFLIRAEKAIEEGWKKSIKECFILADNGGLYFIKGENRRLKSRIQHLISIIIAITAFLVFNNILLTIAIFLLSEVLLAILNVRMTKIIVSYGNAKFFSYLGESKFRFIGGSLSFKDYPYATLLAAIAQAMVLLSISAIVKMLMELNLNTFAIFTSLSITIFFLGTGVIKALKTRWNIKFHLSAMLSIMEIARADGSSTIRLSKIIIGEASDTASNKKRVGFLNVLLSLNGYDSITGDDIDSQKIAEKVDNLTKPSLSIDWKYGSWLEKIDTRVVWTGYSSTYATLITFMFIIVALVLLKLLTHSSPLEFAVNYSIKVSLYGFLTNIFILVAFYLGYRDRIPVRSLVLSLLISSVYLFTTHIIGFLIILSIIMVIIALNNITLHSNMPGRGLSIQSHLRPDNLIFNVLLLLYLINLLGVSNYTPSNLGTLLLIIGSIASFPIINSREESTKDGLKRILLKLIKAYLVISSILLLGIASYYILSEEMELDLALSTAFKEYLPIGRYYFSSIIVLGLWLSIIKSKKERPIYAETIHLNPSFMKIGFSLQILPGHSTVTYVIEYLKQRRNYKQAILVISIILTTVALYFKSLVVFVILSLILVGLIGFMRRTYPTKLGRPSLTEKVISEGRQSVTPHHTNYYFNRHLSSITSFKGSYPMSIVSQIISLVSNYYIVILISFALLLTFASASDINAIVITIVLAFLLAFIARIMLFQIVRKVFTFLSEFYQPDLFIVFDFCGRKLFISTDSETDIGGIEKILDETPERTHIL